MHTKMKQKHHKHNIYYALGGNTALSSGQEYQQFKYTDKEYDPMHDTRYLCVGCVRQRYRGELRGT